MRRSDPIRRRTPAVVLVLALLAAPGLQAPRLAAQSASFEQLQSFSSVLNQIRLHHVDSVTYAGMVRAAIDGVLRSLDPHSHFLPRRDAARLLAYESGRLAGAGLFLSEADGVPTVQSVVPDGPAARAGLAPGDRLLSVNDTSVAGATARSLQAELVGERGEKLRLTVERGPRLEPESLRVTLRFEVLEPRSVTATRMLDPRTGYLRLQAFHARAAEEVAAALGRLRANGAGRVILDLRGNPGGFADASVEVAAELFPRGTLVFRSRGRRRDVEREFRTVRTGGHVGLPLVVLIDEGTASAAEALAAALQDHDRALVVGRRSFGKALVQRGFEVPPSGDYVWLTVGYVESPSGRVIQRRYAGLSAEQYHRLTGGPGAATDTLAGYRTAGGRVVRGGGGVMPDVALPAPPRLPAWWSVAADSGYDDAVADSVAHTLPADPAARAAWNGAAEEWRDRLLAPFLERVRSRLGVGAAVDRPTEDHITRRLATRVAFVRWPPDGGEEFALRTDPDVRTALGLFPRLGELLAPAR